MNASPNDRKLHPDAELIEKAGDTYVVARLCQVKPPAVSQWKISGIPQARLMYLRAVKPDIFGTAPASSEAAA